MAYNAQHGAQHQLCISPVVGVLARQVEARCCKLPPLEALPTVLHQCRGAIVHARLCLPGRGVGIPASEGGCKLLFFGKLNMPRLLQRMYQ